MAETEGSQFSLLSLEDELTCSICLSTFDCPVTIPCGHNFCQDCLLATWEETRSCPQCRAHIPTKPELKKNTVLSTVVETFNLGLSKSEVNLKSEEKKAEVKDVVRCDTCMEAEASQTCLTCMASYCEEHLRPHRENPNFAVHQLTAVVSDLSERICPDHHKLMELFCSDHDRPICSLCLQQVHRGCSFISPEEQRSQKESELREKLSMLDGKIERTDTVVFQMNDLRSKLMDGAVKRKAAMAAVYQQMRDMLAQDERESQNAVDRELETCQTKLQDLLKKLTDNAVQMRKAREDINSLLSQAQTPAFLQVSFDLPWVVKIEPYVPRITLDSKKVTATQAYAVALKEHLTESFKLPVEARLPIFRPEPNPGIGESGKKTAPVSGPAHSAPQPESEPPAQTRPPRSHSPGRPLIQTYFQPVPVPVFSYQGSQQGWNSSQYAHGMAPDFKRGPPFKAGQKPQKKSDSSHQPPHHQEKKKPSTPGGNKQGGAKPGSTKEDRPKGHHASGKSAKHNPQPKKKN